MCIQTLFTTSDIIHHTPLVRNIELKARFYIKENLAILDEKKLFDKKISHCFEKEEAMVAITQLFCIFLKFQEKHRSSTFDDQMLFPLSKEILNISNGFEIKLLLTL